MRWIDSEGRPWVFSVNVTTVKRCRVELGVDLVYQEAGPPAAGGNGSTSNNEPTTEHLADLLTRLTSDAVFFFDVAACLLRDQIKAAGISEEEFGAGLMDMDVVGAAVDALTLAILEFFPLARREVMKSAFHQMKRITKQHEEIHWKNAASLIENDLERLTLEAIATGQDISETIGRALTSGSGNTAQTRSKVVTDSPENAG